MVPTDLPQVGPCDPLAESDYNDDSDAKDVEDIDKANNTPWLVGYTDPDNCILVTEGGLESLQLPTINPISYEPEEDGGEDFDVKITDKVLALLKDAQEDIRCEKVVKFLFLDFEGKGYFEWIAARVRSYITCLIRLRGYTQRYYKSEVDKVVLGTHIAPFFGVQIARIFYDFP